MKIGTIARGLLLAALALMAASCGGDDPQGPPPTTDDDISAVIAFDGGTLAATGPDGVSLELDIPAGAILTATPVRIRALAAPAGKVARFVIEPSGLALLAPATLTVTLPAGMAVDAAHTLVFERSEAVPLPTVVDAGARTLRSTGYSLGFGDLSIFEQPTTKSASEGGEEFLDVEAIGCQFLAESLDLAIFRAQAFSGVFPPDLASPLIQEYRAALLICGSDSLTDITAQLQQYACANAEGALLNSQVILVESAADLRQILGTLVAADGLIRMVDGDCAITPTDYETELNEYLDAFIDRVASPDFVTSFATWDALWQQIVPCVEIASLAQQFGAQAAEDRIVNELFPALFARLHEVAVGACTGNEDNHYLLDLLSGGHDRGHPVGARELPQFSGLDLEEVVEEVHRCASGIVVETTTRVGDPLEQVRFAAAAAGGSLLVTVDGRIRLTGDIQNFFCDGLLNRPPLAVRAEVPGQLPAVPLGNLETPLIIDVGSVTATLPAVNGAPPRQFDLVVERPRPVCGQGASGPIELWRIRVNTHGFEGSLAGTWSGCGAESGTFSIAIAHDGTVSGTYEGTAAGDITGLVTSNGSLSAVASGGPCDWTGTLTLTGGQLAASGTWNCSAGCGGIFQSTP